MGPSFFEWLRRNGEVDAIAKVIREENHFEARSRWDDQPGGHGKYTIGYGTVAGGPGMMITPDEANRELIITVRHSILKFEDAFRYCPHKISKVRSRALIRLIFYMGYHQFHRQVEMIAAIYKNDWNAAARELRLSEWYDYHGQRARCIVRELRDDSYCHPEEKEK